VTDAAHCHVSFQMRAFFIRMGDVMPLRFLLAIGGICCLAGLATAATNWIQYRSSDGGFAVLFPAMPKERVEPAKESPVVSHEYLVEAGNTTYVVSFDDFAPNTFAGREPQRILDSARNKLISGQPVKLLVDKPIALANRPGREIVFVDDVGYTQMYRIYVVRDRLYQTITGGPEGSNKSADAVRFHDSFQILGE